MLFLGNGGFDTQQEYTNLGNPYLRSKLFILRNSCVVQHISAINNLENSTSSFGFQYPYLLPRLLRFSHRSLGPAATCRL